MKKIESFEEVKSYEDALSVLELTESVMPDFSNTPEDMREALTAHFKLLIINKAINQGWVPDWNNRDQYKYFPWLEVDASKQQPGGFGFSRTFYGYTLANAHVGSRLCYEASDQALYVGKQFADLYKSYFLITK